MQSARKLAVVTGASSGIGMELARLAANDSYDLIIAADEQAIELAAEELRLIGVEVEAIVVDLSTAEGVGALVERIEADPRPVELLFANAGRGLGNGFLDQEPERWRHVVDTNITGSLLVIQSVARLMREHGAGRILITGSIAGFMPGSFQAVYNGTKAFMDSFSFALRDELRDSGVSVTCLMPGPTETRFFERADLLDTQIGQDKKDDPAVVARAGYKALMNGDGDVVSGWKNKVQASLANVLPSEMLARQHRKMAEPGSAEGS